MSDMDNEEELIISPSDSDRVILQRSAGLSGTMNTTVDKGIMSSVVTDPSLVMKTIRTLHAKAEELQQEATRARKHMSWRENYVEKRFREKDKLITVLKRKRCDSCSNYASSAKQSKSSTEEERPKTTPLGGTKTIHQTQDSSQHASSITRSNKGIGQPQPWEERQEEGEIIQLLLCLQLL